jgi:hypothetical protein
MSELEEIKKPSKTKQFLSNLGWTIAGAVGFVAAIYLLGILVGCIFKVFSWGYNLIY